MGVGDRTLTGETMNGLLAGAMPPPPQQAGGLLGGLSGGAPAAPAGNQGLQMAQQLAQSPTPQMAQQIIQQMKQAGMPEADQIAQALQQLGDDPEAIKHFADQVVQVLSSQ